MNTYILTVFAASLVAAMLQLVSPRGEGGRLASHIRMIAGLFLLVALLKPITEGIALLREAADGELAGRLEALLPEPLETDYTAILGDTLTEVSCAEVESFAVSALEEHFGVPPSGCTVSAVCAYEGGTLILTELRIALHGVYIAKDPHPIEDFFAERLECDCFVTVGARE